MNILLDGLNFELQRGTGIKTYSRSVVAALHAAGHSVDILSQARFIVSGNESPLVAYTKATTGQSQQRKSLVQKILDEAKAANSGFRGRISLSDAAERQKLVDALAAEWAFIDHLQVSPGLFLKSFAKAGLGMGLTKAPGTHDIFFLTSPIPVRQPGAMNVLTVHDVIPLSHPHLVASSSLVSRALKRTLQYSLASADKVICVSETSKQEMLKLFKVDERKLHVVYQPCRFSLMQEQPVSHDPAILQELGLGDEPYVLFLGAIEPKKNLLNLLKAIEQHPDIPNLVVIGQFAWSSDREKAMIDKLGARVKHLGYLNENQMQAALSNAKAFVFPSIIEGFGLPVLEALWKGIPCVISDIPVFRELFSGKAILVQPDEPDSIAAGIQQAIHQEQDKTLQVQKEIRSHFSLESFSQQLVEVLQ